MRTGIIILPEIKNGNLGFPPDIHYCNILFNSFLLDPCALTTAASQEVKFGFTYFTHFVEGNRLNMRRGNRESPFHAHTVRNLTDGKSGGMSFALAFDHIAFEALDPFFITFLDFIIDGNIVSCFKPWKGIISGKLLMYKCYCRIHNLKFKDGKGRAFSYYLKEN